MAKNAARCADRGFKIARHLGHRSDEQIAEAMPGEPFAAAKAMIEQFFHERLDVGQCEQRVANISRRRHTQIVPQPSRTSSVIGYGDNGGQVARIFLETPQHGRQAGAAPNDDDARASLQIASLVDDIRKARCVTPGAADSINELNMRRNPNAKSHTPSKIKIRPAQFIRPVGKYPVIWPMN